MSEVPDHVNIIRRRFIPNETTYLNKDTVYEMSPERVLTAWRSLKPRADIAGGTSAYYPDLGVKISRVYNHEYQLVYWYCDIIQMEYSPNQIYYEDLLVDVLLMPDGKVKVLDADELAQALEQGLITQEQACLALRRLNNLLTIIYEGRLGKLLQPILELEKTLIPTISPSA